MYPTALRCSLRKQVIVASLLGWQLQARNAHANVLAGVTEAELCANGRWILTGTVSEVKTYRATGELAYLHLFQRVSVHVDTTYYGSPPKEVELFIPGGDLDGEIWTWGEPNFERGARVFIVGAPPNPLSFAEWAMHTQTVQLMDSPRASDPPAELGRLARDEHCVPGYSGPEVSRQFIHTIPHHWLQICTHYGREDVGIVPREGTPPKSDGTVERPDAGTDAPLDSPTHNHGTKNREP